MLILLNINYYLFLALPRFFKLFFHILNLPNFIHLLI
jgi:hypothetical protein